MANSKITGLPAIGGTPDGTDLIEFVTDVAGTPTSKKGTVTELMGAVPDDSITLAKMAGGTNGNLITYDASGDPAYVATGDATQVLTSNGVDTAPTFQGAGGAGKDMIEIQVFL